MKQIKNYINEKLHVTSKSFYTCQPKTSEELHDIIIQRIKEDGPECNLNDIDVSKITDMMCMFDADTTYGGNDIFKDFNGDISQWDVSNVTDMNGMFRGCKKFNGDISRWNVSKVKDMQYMFINCYKFNCDLSRWNVSNVNDMNWMFGYCKNFNQNIDDWDVSNVKTAGLAFSGCPTKPKWYYRNKWE